MNYDQFQCGHPLSCRSSCHRSLGTRSLCGPPSEDKVHPQPQYNLKVSVKAEVEFVHAVSAGGSVKFLPAV